MNIDNYKKLISNLPVRQQSSTTKRSTWQKAENKFGWLQALNKDLFGNQGALKISRQDIFDTKGPIRELIIKTIYWGYERGMRGNHFVNILEKISFLESTFNDLKSKKSLSNNDFTDLTEKLKNISGIGLSTYSKLLYFLNIKFNDSPCLILDKKLMDVFSGNIYREYLELGQINEDNKKDFYLPYLDITNKLSIRLKTQGENIEHFLFTFGNNLK